MSNTKEEKPTETGVALNIANLSQSDIPALLSKVVEQIKALGGAPKNKTVTNPNLAGFGDVTQIEKTQELIKAYSSVSSKMKYYAECATEIMPVGHKVPKFTLGDNTGDEWLDLIKERLEYVANKTKLDKLKAVKSKLEANLSAEEKLKKDLGDISTILFE